MKLFKYIIRADEWKKLPDNPDLEVSGCVAVTVAEDAAGARANLERYAAENGMDSRWLAVARVVELPITAGTVCAWVMT